MCFRYVYSTYRTVLCTCGLSCTLFLLSVPQNCPRSWRRCSSISSAFAPPPFPRRRSPNTLFSNLFSVWTSQAYPTHARSLGTSASTATNWLGNALVSATFLTLADSSLEQCGTFWLYAIIGALGWVWLYTCMPETKGLPLEEVQRLFARDGDPSLTPDGNIFGGKGAVDTERRVGADWPNNTGAVMSGNRHRASGFAPLGDD